MRLPNPPVRVCVCGGGGHPPQAACDRVITVGAVRLGDLVTGRQERAADRRCASYKVDQSVSSVLPQLLHANMDCGVVISKTVLLFLSLVFWAAGAALAYVGAYVIKSYDNFDSFIQDRYTLIPAVIIICISAVMFIFGLVGCCATIRESKVGLGFFFMIIMLIFAAEVAALVFGFIYRGKITQDLDHSMNEVFKKYDGQSSESSAADYLQTQLNCCGVHNYTSWIGTPWYTSHNNTVPLSCCKNSTGCTGRLDQLDLLNLQGCETELDQLFRGVLGYALLVILGFAIIKLFGMLSVCVISCKTQRSGYQPLYA